MLWYMLSKPNYFSIKDTPYNVNWNPLQKGSNPNVYSFPPYVKLTR